MTTPPASTYRTAAAERDAVAFGVSVVPVEGWSVLVAGDRGKQLVTYAPNGEPRAFFWVRQKENVTAQALRARHRRGRDRRTRSPSWATVRNLPCPKDVLEECVAISYTSTRTRAMKVQGWVEAYRRKDGVVTALDFRTRVDFAPKAEADAVDDEEVGHRQPLRVGSYPAYIP